MIHSTGFFRMKAKNLLGMARAVVQHHGGEIPQTMEELIGLPGVARKTANVVLGTAFGKNEGVVVDTHVTRLAERLGLSTHTDPVKIEQDLMTLLPREQWTIFAHRLIIHGRRVCYAKQPDCENCLLAPLCPSAFTLGPSPSGRRTPSARPRSRAGASVPRRGNAPSALPRGVTSDTVPHKSRRRA